jgi:predicted nucleic acid-binding protein
VTVIFVDQDIDAESWALLKARQDKDWSLVDASSFVVMQRYGITEALTIDGHFRQAGFTWVPSF